MSGNCDEGYTFRWNDVPLADSFEVQREDRWLATVRGTERFFPPEELRGATRVTVVAMAMTRPESPDSNALNPGC